MTPTEQTLNYGDGGRNFGILTNPCESSVGAYQSPVFVFLSAGGLHRVGPHRLHVRLARELATIGFTSFRVDLSGNGESPPRSGISYQKAVSEDCDDLLTELHSRLGDVSVVLCGLCSGADNAIRLASNDPRVVGLVLLDPVCGQDKGFALRALRIKVKRLFGKLTSPSKYLPWLKRRFQALKSSSETNEQYDLTLDNLSLRNVPTVDQQASAMNLVRERNGKVLSVFSEYAVRYYNEEGQMGRVLDIDHYDRFATERFWPQSEHNYPLESHRRKLIQEIKDWAAAHFPKSAA